MATCLMEFVSKKEGKITGMTYKPHPDIKPYLYPGLW